MRRKQNKANKENKVKIKKKTRNSKNQGDELLFPKKKLSKSKQNTDDGTREKSGGRKLKKVIKGLLFAIIAVIIFYVMKNRHILGITLSRKVTDKEVTIIDINSSESSIIPYRNELLVYSKGNMSTYSKYGEKTWEHSLEETFIPYVIVKGKYVQVVNKDTGYLYIFSNKYEKARKKIDGKIKDATINTRGDSAIYYSTSGVKSAIGIYNNTGNLKYKVTLKNSNVVRMELSDNSKYLAIYDVESAGVSISSSIKLISFNNKNDITEIFKIDGDVIYDMFFSGNKIVVICSNAIYTYDLLSKAQNKIDITDRNISFISADYTGSACLYKDISNDSSIIEMQSSILNINNKIKTEEAPKYFKYENNLAYVTYGKKMYIYNRWGLLVKRYDSETIITEPIIFNSGKNIAIKYSNKIVIVGI